MKALKAAIGQILRKAHNCEWSLQGFGMLRLYLTKETRLHIWSESHVVPGVSEIHDHPWDFTSKIVAGRLHNCRYVEGAEGDTYMAQTILCGPNGCAMGDVRQVKLWQKPTEVYDEGDKYEQRANEIHRSAPEDGTVTIVTRRFLPDPDHANVFWRPNEEWVSAEPRPATPEEVAAIVGNALQRWF